MFNRFIGVGNLARDPELRYLPNGTPVAKLTVAFNTRYRQDGEMKEEALFLDAISFGKQAESCKQYLSKGHPVLVEGRLKERSWEQDGVTKRKIEVIASSIRFLGRKKEDAPHEEASEEPLPAEASYTEPF